MTVAKRMTQKEYDAFRKRENERKQEWRIRKRLEQEQQKTKPSRISSPQVHRRPVQEEMSGSNKKMSGLNLGQVTKKSDIDIVHREVDALVGTKPSPPHGITPEHDYSRREFADPSDHVPMNKVDRHDPSFFYEPKTTPPDEEIYSPPGEQMFTKSEVRSMLVELMQQQKPERVLLTRSERKALAREQRGQEQHLKGKPMQFAKKREETRPLSRRQARSRERAARVFTEAVPEGEPAVELDVVAEQTEKPKTTRYCPESVKEDGLKEVRKNPEYYIEINMVTDSRVVDTFFIPAECPSFHYKEKIYEVDEETIYLLPTKLGPFMPTCHYKEGILKPRGFKQTNKGITGKALSLLYMEQLYTSLLYSEDVKYNLFIVILSIVNLVCFGIGTYFLLLHNGGILPHILGG